MDSQAALATSHALLFDLQWMLDPTAWVEKYTQ